MKVENVDMIVRMAAVRMCRCPIFCVSEGVFMLLSVLANFCMYVFHLRKVVNEGARVLLRVIVMTTMPCNEYYS